MADAWGTLTFTKSVNCEIDAEGLTAALNQFRWDNWGGQWECDGGEALLWYSEQRAQYPTIFPKIETTIYCYSDSTGSEYMKLLPEMSDEDSANFDYAEHEDCSLEQLKLTLQPFIKKGWIEIACVSNEKQRYVELGSLCISADNASSRSYCCSGPQTESKNFTESV